MKIYKRILSIILSFLIILLTLIPAFATGNQISDYDYLRQCGFSTDFLDKITPSIMEKIKSQIGDSEIMRIEEVKESTFADIPENMKLSEVFLHLKDTKTGYKREMVCIIWQMDKGKPFIKGPDLFTFRFNDKNLAFRSFYGEDCWKNNAEDKWTVNNTYSNPAQAQQDEIGYFANPAKFKNYVGGCILLDFADIRTGENVNYDSYSFFNSDITVSYFHKEALINATIFFIIVTAVVLIVIVIICVCVIKSKKKKAMQKK